MTISAEREEEDGEEEDDDDASDLSAEAALLLPHCWRLLLECLTTRLKPASNPTARRVLKLLTSYGEGFLARTIAVLERNALPMGDENAPLEDDVGGSPAAAHGSSSSSPSAAPPAMVFNVSACMLNHSCVPNCVVKFGGGDAAGDGGDAIVEQLMVARPLRLLVVLLVVARPRWLLLTLLVAVYRVQSTYWRFARSSQKRS